MPLLPWGKIRVGETVAPHSAHKGFCRAYTLVESYTLLFHFSQTFPSQQKMGS